MSRSCPLPSPVAFSPRTIAEGIPRVLPVTKLGGTGDLVRDRDVGCVQDVSRRVVSTLQVEERCHSRHTERDVGRAPPKRSSEGVADDDRNVLARQLADAFTEAAGRSVRIDGKENEGVEPSRFDWSTPADAQTKPCRVSAMTRGRPGAHDPTALPEDHLQATRILVRRRALGPRSDGATSSRCTTRPSTFDTAF